MKIRRIVTAESKSGVVLQASDLPETATAGLPTNIWGFDQFRPCPSQPSRCSASTSKRACSVRKVPSESTSCHFPRRRATRRGSWSHSGRA